MKRLGIIGVIIIGLFFPNLAKADTIFNIEYGVGEHKEIYYLQNLPWDTLYNTETEKTIDCNGRNDCYEKAINLYQQSKYNYYSIWISINPNTQIPHIEMGLYLFDVNSNDTITQYVVDPNRFRFEINNKTVAQILDGYSDPNYNNFYGFYDSNYNFINSNKDTYLFEGFYNNEDTTNYTNLVKIEPNGTIPKIKDLINYSSWSDYENENLENYNTVNLDNYYYVLLSLKNYNQNEPFTTNLQVKGQIGITPIYNYGQTTKDAVTGVKVQDRCNVTYENYTSYPFYILKQDLQNNVVYAIKECSKGSEFKYDTTIFDITYVTDENKDDPVVTIDGKQYHTIPFDNLPSTANKNEKENYIPGESGSANSEGGLSGALKGIQQKMSEIWDIITFFSGFVNTMFSILPEPIRIILLSAFAIAITLGLIKIFIN